ncbi:hypothetical protein H6F86_29410 [Phormidium sp. FACHB-592]|nr:hypothetical protein [Phormidium sp. FACHB-592]
MSPKSFLRGVNGVASRARAALRLVEDLHPLRNSALNISSNHLWWLEYFDYVTYTIASKAG